MSLGLTGLPACSVVEDDLDLLTSGVHFYEGLQSCAIMLGSLSEFKAGLS